MRNDTTLQDRSIRLRGLRFHYRDWGRTAAPPLVLLHGGWESSRTWDVLAARLAGHYRVLALDQRGHGASDHAADYAVLTMVEDLAAFVETLRLRPVSLFGFSVGGAVAMLYAGQQPAAVARLVIVDHGPDVVELLRPRLAERGTTLTPPPPTDPALTLPEPVLSSFPPAEEQWALLAQITCPTLLLRGERSGHIGPDTARRMAGALRDGRLIEIPESGHLILKDNPAGLLTAVTHFLLGDNDAVERTSSESATGTGST